MICLFPEGAITRTGEMAGGRRGVARLARRTGGTFGVEPVSASSAEDELAVTHARLQLTLDTRQIQTDVVVVWRLHNNRVVEVWDIPAVHAPSVGAA